jgi:class 3 adenylate cyclase/tetratricopeptide (TPR) repeat protein
MARVWYLASDPFKRSFIWEDDGHDGRSPATRGAKVSTCTACRAPCPDGARFCPGCGAELLGRTGREERRLVTVLCCDLVDFTSACEACDPEDVDAVLREYSVLARQQIETLGGRVEKYIGDAVVAVFGVPRAREDDAERAVHAALRILSGVEALPPLGGARPQVRIGVNTGEALVRLDVDPASGQGFMVGDAVNTAARLQSASPPMGVVTGEVTHALTADRFEFRGLEPVLLKGKRTPVRPWLVTGTRARLGLDLSARYSTSLVGRSEELRALQESWERAVRTSTPHLVVLVGEAGIGKSRLIYEFAQILDRRPDVLTWRQGRCTSYGDGIEFGALGQIVKAHAGIIDSDGAATAEAKLRRAVPDGPDAAWLLARLRPLVGLMSPAASAEENLSAWQGFFEGLARSRPTVLVVEDLQHASEAMLSFLTRLAERSARVPLLVIGAGRPELHWAVIGRPESGRTTRLDVTSLPPHDTRRLVEDLLGEERAVVLAEPITGRCGGNPLYAEECVRLLQERVPTDELGHSEIVSAAESALPRALQALVAARLDALDRVDKEILADAAVVGLRFWRGAVASVGSRDPDEVLNVLGRLTERELIRSVARSSVDDEHEFVFWHSITHDVAYDQIKRGVRAAKHESAARWIRETMGESVGELAEDVARHYAAALKLARAAGEKALLQRITDPAVAAFSVAGDRALGLDVAAAERHYLLALELVGGGDPRRPPLLVSWGDALSQAGRFDEATAVMEEGVAALQAAGDLRAAAGALPHLLHLRQVHNMDTQAPDLEVLLATLADQEPSAELLRLLNATVTLRLLTPGDHEEAIRMSDRSLSVCRELGLPESPSALENRGVARCGSGDRGGLRDMRRAVEESRTQGLGHEVGEYYCNLADMTLLYEGPAAATAIREEGLVFAARRGDQAATSYLRTNRLFDLFQSGSWTVAATEAHELSALLEAQGDLYDLQSARSVHALILAGRGDPATAEALVVRAEKATRQVQRDPVRTAVLTSLATVRAAQGRAQEARALVEECAALAQLLSMPWWWAYHIPLAARCAAAAGDLALVSRLTAQLVRGRDYDDVAAVTLEALVAEGEGDTARGVERFDAAARQWDALDIPPERAHALSGGARCLVAQGRTNDAAALAAAAWAIFNELGAAPAAAACDALVTSPSRGSAPDSGTSLRPLP